MAGINIPIVSKFIDKGVKEAEGAFGGLQSSLGKIAGLVATAFSVKAVIDFGKESLIAAENVAQANARLEQIAESMDLFGSETDNVSARLIELAESQEILLGTDAELIKQTQAKLLTFKELAGSADEAGGAFDRATIAAIDLAAAGFGTAEGNATQLGKALNDPIAGLSSLNRIGVTFTAEEKEKIKTLTESNQVLEAQEIILGKIETKVGGTAEATATASERMKLAFENVKETTGATLLPAFEEVGTAMLPLIEYLMPKLEEFLDQRIAPALEKVTGWFSLVSEEIVATDSVVGPLLGSFQDLAEKGLDKVVGFFTGDGLTQLLTAFAEVRTAIINAFIEIIPLIVGALVEMLPAIVQTLADMIPDLLTAAVETFTALVDAVAEVLPVLLVAILDMLPDLIDTIVSLIPDIIDAGIQLFDGLIQALVKVIPDLLEAFIDSVPDITDSIIDALPDIIEAAFTLFTGIVTAILEATPDIVDALIRLIPKMVTALQEQVPKLIDAGWQLLQGLGKGISDNIPKIIGTAVTEIGDALIGGVNKILGIKSPSRVFMGIGEDVVLGFEKGLKDGEGLIADASFDMASTVKVGAMDGISGMETLSVSSPATASTSAAPIALNVTVNAGMGADGTDIGRKIVEEILRFERSSGRVFVRA